MEQIQLDIQPKDTTRLQLSSVVKFMNELQYYWYPITKCFNSVHPINKGRSIRSLTTGVLLHNNFYTEWHGTYLDAPFEDMPWKWFEAAKQAKIVTSVSLQHSRKKGIIAQKMWVRFADTENGKLFKAKYV